MQLSRSFLFLAASLCFNTVHGQLKHPYEAAPFHYDEQWSEYDKCHFFDPRNEFWDHHKCEYVDCSFSSGSCEDAIDGKWPVMETRYRAGCHKIHDFAPVAPSSSCWAGKMMTLCCTNDADANKIVSVIPFHQRKHDYERYWPYR
ncbi:hypothetical protein PRIPAC_88683 [Pristionchus pacificus]|uniref:Uncharacterized protein n=1 Tax=Pristionchus pacificus TaxID=54126 RepID=A0A2A6CYB7_PRIPA|nr:hypothetical protein PRIPAC_88683 [Pristionchus pacificus]|eukprot:PDM83128.1 hypothetical protein PRIPAC_37521 [Pristionchus pacificus]